MKVTFPILISFTVLFFSCSSKKDQWLIKKTIKNPESIYYYAQQEMIFVSNVHGEGNVKDKKGHISLLSRSGDIIDPFWLEGLDAPKGMRAHKGVLWVTDIDRVHAINIKDKEIVKTYKVTGAKFLNDIAIDGNDIYASDTLTSKIFKISNGEVSVFASGKRYESPNGLLVLGEELYVAAWGYTKDWSTKKLGRLYSLNLKTRKKKLITKKPLGNLDGLEIDKNKNFIVSDWVAGKVYAITKSGDVTLLFEGRKGLADIGLISNSELLLVPNMLESKVYTHKLKDK